MQQVSQVTWPHEAVLPKDERLSPSHLRLWQEVTSLLEAWLLAIYPHSEDLATLCPASSPRLRPSHPRLWHEVPSLLEAWPLAIYPFSEDLATLWPTSVPRLRPLRLGLWLPAP